MNPETLIRLGWAATLIASGLGLFNLMNRLLLKRAQMRVHTLDLPEKGVPAILYFTTPACIPCKTVQRPAIQRLRELMGDRLQIIEIDAASQPEVASQWGVMSVPTTFIIDPQGRARHINHGVTTADKLLSQIQNIS